MLLCRPAVADEDPQQLLDSGIAAYDRGDFSSARKTFDRLVQLAPTKPNPHRWLGLTEAKLGECALSAAELRLFLRMVPPNDPRVAEVERVMDNCRVTPAPAPPPPAVVVQVEAKPADKPPRKRPYWAIGVAAGVVVVGVALGVGLGLGLRPSDPAFTPVGNVP
jgi:hypothetical protein